MKSYISLALSVLMSVTLFAQNNNASGNTIVPKLAGKVAPNNNGKVNYVQNATLTNLHQFLPFTTKNNQPTAVSQNLSAPFNLAPNVSVRNNAVTQVLDPRGLTLSPNGKLLTPDGYEVEFRTSGNPKVTDVCATPRPYINGGANKNAACSFTVPCDDAANRDAASTTQKYFMLRWHVITNGSPSDNIDQAMITAMMNTLNADYAAHNMVFCEDSAEWNDDAVNYFHDSNTEEVSLKAAYNTRPTDLINIYVVGDMTAGGYARFPYDPWGGPDYRGGIVLNRSNCNATGHTLAHEMGHTFGLEHTFAGVDERGSCSDCYERVRHANGSSNASGAPTPLGGPYNTEGDREGDWCSDTNPHDTYSYNCSTSTNPNNPTCDTGGPWNNAPVDNHMSYSFCSTQFTTQQGYRQHCMVNSYLSSWTNYGGGICGSLPPVADFVGTPTTWQSPSTVNFTDLSMPTSIITSWTWDFNSVGQAGTVTPATFTGQNPPSVIYDIGASATCLQYAVKLTITGNGGDVEEKLTYIEVCPPSGDCDTLDFQWETPTPDVVVYSGVTPTDILTGIPDASSLATFTDPKGIYEGYVTPNLGVTTVGSIRVALGGLNDADDDVTFQVSVYDDDGNGQPGAFLSGVGGISPTALGVPGGAYNWFTIPLLTPATPTTNFFHVGVEMFAGDATDGLVVMSSCAGPATCAVPQGEADSSNNIFTTNFGFEKIMPVFGYDFDVGIIPILGEAPPLPQLTGLTETLSCDTTVLNFTDTVYYHNYAGSALVGMSYTFASDGSVINTTTPLGSFTKTYTSAGTETLTITAINDCGRADTVIYTIPYNFMATPDAEFSMTPANPICMGAPGVDFTANTAGYHDYNWDFGDGTVASSLNVPTINHIYTAPGLYYTTLTTTSLSFEPTDIFYYEDFAAGIPGTYTLVDQDGLTNQLGINVWTGIGGSALSSSFFNPAGIANDWMITPAIAGLPADQILSWRAAALDAALPDGYEVRLSTTGALPATVANFSTVLASIPAENGFFTTRSVSLASYAGQTIYIAFVNNSNDMFVLAVDDVWIGTNGGCEGTVTKTDFVEVVDCSVTPPIANMNASDTAGCAPLTVTFTDSTTVGLPLTSWLWNFGDGSFSTVQNPPPHLYATPGTYFTSLEVCNAGGCFTDFQTIIVGTGTIALAGTDQNLCAVTTATLAGNDPTPDPGMWALISGTGTPTTTTAFNSGVTGLTIGTNQFTWTITGAGCTSVDTVDIVVTANPANAGVSNTLGICPTGSSIDLHPLLGAADLGGTWIGPSALTGGDQGTFAPATNLAGTYQYYVTGVAPCGNDTADIVVTFSGSDDPTFLYPDFCEGAGGVAGVINTPGGSFSFDPDPLDGSAINATTGAVTNGVGGSTYGIKYKTLPGVCQDSLTLSVNVIAPVNPGTSTTLTACSSAGATDLYTLLGGADLGGAWSGPSVLTGGDQGTFTPGVNVAGTYKYLLTGTTPCGNDSADVVVTINTSPDPTFTYADFCSNATGVAGTPVTPGGTFSFSPDPLDGSAINATTGDVTNGVAGSVYNIQYLTPAGPCQDSLTLNVNVNLCITADFTASSLTICAGDSIVFTDASTVGVTIWQWDFDSTSLGGVTPSGIVGQGPHTVFYNTPGTYIIELIASNGGILDTASVTVTVTDCSPTADFTASQTTLCEADCITFNDLSTGTPTAYAWSFPGGTPATATGANPGSICYSTVGTYSVTLTVTNQYGVDSVTMTSLITVDPCDPPIAAITINDADAEICENGCIDFTYNNDSLGGIPDTLFWTFPGGTPSSYGTTSLTDVVTVCWNDTSGNFLASVSATNAYGNSVATQSIGVHLNPIINAGGDISVDIGSDGAINSTVTDTGGNVLPVTNGIFSWSPSTFLGTPNSQGSSVIQPTDTTTYTVTYTDEYGCVVSDDVVVNVNIVLNIGVPSAFTPGSSFNNLLFVKGKIVIESMNFVIYNRYGQQVFETTNIDEGWDGTHNGKQLNPGVFVYYLKVTFIDGSQGELKGNVTLIK